VEETYRKEKVLNYLKMNHTGEEKAVQSRWLGKKLHISNRTIRNVVNTLRCEGNPICSDENGYYYAANRKEILRSIGQLNSRIGKIAKAKQGLKKALSLFSDAEGQIQLEFQMLEDRGNEILTVL
jgi:biotin operon repressor